MREREFVEEPRDAAIERAVAVAARLMGERAGDEGLAGAGGPGDEHVVVLGDPAAGGELAEQRLVELTLGPIVDGLDAGLGQAELGLLERALQAAVLAGEPLGVDEQAEALVEGEGGVIGACAAALARRGPSRGGAGRRACRGSGLFSIEILR